MSQKVAIKLSRLEDAPHSLVVTQPHVVLGCSKASGQAHFAHASVVRMDAPAKVWNRKHDEVKRVSKPAVASSDLVVRRLQRTQLPVFPFYRQLNLADTEMLSTNSPFPSRGCCHSLAASKNKARL